MKTADTHDCHRRRGRPHERDRGARKAHGHPDASRSPDKRDRAAESGAGLLRLDHRDQLLPLLAQCPVPLLAELVYEGHVHDLVFDVLGG
jgi:hypothetical protein